MNGSRRQFLHWSARAVGALAVTNLTDPGDVMAAPAATAEVNPAARYLIVNADDFGMCKGVNRGIIEAHARGIVTSTSLMVTRPVAAEDAAQRAREHPSLDLGLHVDLTNAPRPIPF